MKKKPSYNAIKKALANHPDLEWEIRVEPEEIQIEGNASAVDPTTDRETNEWIRTELASGNMYAWCWVSVKVTWREFEACDSLGAVSCTSEDEFKNAFLVDMKAEALAQLASNISETHNAISRLILGGE